MEEEIRRENGIGAAASDSVGPAQPSGAVAPLPPGMSAHKTMARSRAIMDLDDRSADLTAVDSHRPKSVGSCMR
eukprot:SAG11_NODE_27682_length_330_cov_0.805195_1_plen_73_part_01